jgi:hypothetical protein
MCLKEHKCTTDVFLFLPLYCCGFATITNVEALVWHLGCLMYHFVRPTVDNIND